MHRQLVLISHAVKRQLPCMVMGPSFSALRPTSKNKKGQA